MAREGNRYPVVPARSHMELRRVLAVAFKRHGRDRLEPPAFVTALAIERDWFTPEEVRTFLDRACDEGELERDDDRYVAAFDVGGVAVPSGYSPPEDLLAERTAFERVLADLVSAGHDRRESVAGINAVQSRLAVSSDVAAVVYAHGEGLDVAEEAARIRRTLEGDDGA